MSINKASWTLRGGTVFTPTPFALMGIVNLTPDSFSDGGKYLQPEKALSHAHALWQQGAAFLDLGAESSRPGAAPLRSEEELARLMSVLLPLLRACEEDTFTPAMPVSNTTPETERTQGLRAPYISVDTYHAATAAAVLEAGVPIINDISACLFEPELLDVLAQYKPGYVLMHSTARPDRMQQNLCSGSVMPTLLRFFEEQLHRLTAAGLPEEHIMLDPGIGFGKSVEQNLEILRCLPQLEHFGRPILAALSMKSFLHLSLGIAVENTQARAEATHMATALLGAKGICYHRVHHVAASRRALHLALDLQSGIEPYSPASGKQ